MTVRLIFTLAGAIAIIGAVSDWDLLLKAGKDFKFMKGFSRIQKRVAYFIVGALVIFGAWYF
ncbi:MAG TPA: hypothetical protein PKH77_05005 [Anaerolineae bacterium]|nr:hypothetical protein [Anaerolineae bacterium]